MNCDWYATRSPSVLSIFEAIDDLRVNVFYNSAVVWWGTDNSLLESSEGM
jgi:hypothetical protein